MEGTINVGINGFGRIGRIFLRASLGAKKVRVVAINDPFMTVEHIVYLLKYDTVHGTLFKNITMNENEIIIDGHHIAVYKCNTVETIPWRETSVEYVVECSGINTTTEKAKKHIVAGASKVIISAPPKG